MKNNWNGLVGGTAGFGLITLLTRDATLARRVKNRFFGAAAGFAVSAGVTAEVSAACTTAGVEDVDETCCVTAASVCTNTAPATELVLATAPGTEEPIDEPNDCVAVWLSWSMRTAAPCTGWDPAEGVEPDPAEAGDERELGASTMSGECVERPVGGLAVEESEEDAGVLSGLPGAVVEGVPGVVEGFDFSDDPGVVAVVAGGLLPPEASVFGGVFSCMCELMPVNESEDVGDVAGDAVAGLFVDDADPSVAPESALAIPDPLASAAPKPRVTAPAPSQP